MIPDPSSLQHPTPTMRARLLLLALLAALSLGSCAPTVQEPDADPVVVYLVRHAEREEDGTSDPPLSEAGHERARLLAEMLKDAGITRVHSTDLERTRQTGAPLVEAQEKSVEVYDPADLVALAARLAVAPGRHLVLGHSNTTGEFVSALGGDPGPPIDEAEYDRLYVVVIPVVGPPSTTLLRFGAPYVP